MSDAPGRNDSRAGLSRRQFLKGSGVTAATAALAGTAEAVVQAATADKTKEKTESMGPGPVALTLDVNGAKMETKVEPRVTLLDTLRNHLDVTGCKRVCDRGTCGACTVLLDGKPVYACTTLALEAQGKKVRTAESLVDGDKLDKVPAAFVKADAQQCGFCTPGFVVSMYAAFQANPSAGPGEIEDALSGNICRCGTYEQMRDAIAALCKVKRKEA
ncbi:MAG: (2Fe-2S)-binding protein [Planctomycetes bacterium]|nr:(2Fe-2S)-binding protein [Planctomycetota bacterium]